MSVSLVRAFIQMREQLAANREILKRLTEIDRTLLEPGLCAAGYLPETVAAFAPPPELPKRRIGFRPCQQSMFAY